MIAPGSLSRCTPKRFIRINKALYTQIKQLRLGVGGLFILDNDPMVEIENQVESDTTPTFHDPSNSWVILGCILPTTEPYCRRSFRIKMILSYCFPLDPPEVRFLSPIYHPNVGTNGQFSDERLNKNSRWTYTKTLVDVVKNLVQLIDDPPIDYSLSMELARLYTEDRKRFDEIALEYVLKYGCPRT